VTTSISDVQAAAAARDAARGSDGRFGEWSLGEADPDLAASDLTSHAQAVYEAPLWADADWFSRLDWHQQRDLVETGTYTVLDSGGGPCDVTPGVIDDEADWVYTNGQCLALAVAMSEQTGWPIVVTRDDLGDTIDGEPYFTLRHALVQAPDGTLLDIRGEQGSIDDVLDGDEPMGEGATPLVFEDPYAALEEYEGFLSEQSVAAAEPFAAKVLAQYKAGVYVGEMNYDALTPDDARGLIDPSLVRRYTQGDCGVLAHYLAERNGWGVTIVGDYEVEEWAPDDVGQTAEVTYDVGTLQHAFAALPDGRLIDVTGIHPASTADDLAKRTKHPRHDYPDAATADTIWNHQQWFDSDRWGDEYDDEYDDEDGEAADDAELATHVATLVTIAYGQKAAEPQQD
jgi:hypothetical protein